MPHRPIKKIFDMPAWMDRIDDTCLYEMLVEAIVARGAALRAGILQHPRCLPIFQSADETVDQIAYGRYQGQTACRKAADALRKYQQAHDCMFPPGRHRGSR